MSVSHAIFIDYPLIFFHKYISKRHQNAGAVHYWMLFILNERSIIMNKPDKVIIMSIAKLIDLIQNKVGLQCQYDEVKKRLIIQTTQQHHIFKSEMIGNIDKSNIVAIIQYMKHLDDPSILITSHITNALAEKLQKANIQYIDFSGNMFVKTPNLFISIMGEAPQKLPVLETKIFALNIASIKIIFTLLAVENALTLTYRDIARMSDVALGSVSKTFLMLQQNGYLIEKSQNEKCLVNKKNLFTKWCIGYNEKLRPKLVIEKFGSDNRELLKKVNPADFHLLWGGEMAAAILTHYLKPQIITLYADNELPTLQLKCRLKRDPNGNIELIKKFWNFDSNTDQQNVAPFILIYADLLSAFDERNQETAEIIYDKYIKETME